MIQPSLHRVNDGYDVGIWLAIFDLFNTHKKKYESREVTFAPETTDQGLHVDSGSSMAESLPRDEYSMDDAVERENRCNGDR